MYNAHDCWESVFKDVNSCHGMAKAQVHYTTTTVFNALYSAADHEL